MLQYLDFKNRLSTMYIIKRRQREREGDREDRLTRSPHTSKYHTMNLSFSLVANGLVQYRRQNSNVSRQSVKFGRPCNTPHACRFHFSLILITLTRSYKFAHPLKPSTFLI
jgi:hypothetical protein